MTEKLTESISFARFSFHLKAIDHILLPQYKGSTFRGGFGHAFKRVVCTTKGKPCADCLLYEKCVYSYIFETPPPKDTQIMRKYKAAPHPFVIEPPPEAKSKYLPGEDLTFNLILIGRAIDYLPYFIYTFEELGKMGIGRGRGKFALRQVSSQNAKVKSGERLRELDNIIYTSDSKTLKSDYKALSIKDILSLLDFNISNLTFNFLTPTRIVYNSHLTINIEFHILIRNLLRRISLLSYFHCNGDPEGFDFKGLIEKAKSIETKEKNLQWYDWERYSARQDTKMKMGGFIGKVTYEGDFKELLPFIFLGEYLHAGKGTTFGLGKYEVLKTL